MPPRRPDVKSLVSSIPTGSGVYFFYGPNDELLYVGKSKRLRERVRSHFRDRSERWLTGRIRRIDTRLTAGELGALLLESELIKTMRPMFNVAQRQRRRIVIAERNMLSDGYAAVRLRAVDVLDPRTSDDVLGVFKHTTQAKEFLAAAAKVHRLCPVLLELEVARRAPRGSRRACFSYHLGQCDGACIGEEAAASYNARVERAFLDRRIKAWPYAGGLVIEEQGGDGRAETFLVDNWCLLGSLHREAGTAKPFLAGRHRFDYDTYKLLYAFVASPPSGMSVRIAEEGEWRSLLQAAAAKGEGS